MKYKNNHTLTAVASIAGLAIGAALGVLFAPERGRNLRLKLRSRNTDHHDEEYELLTDHSVEDLWEKTRAHADQLQGPGKKRKNTSKIKVPSAGTMAWKENQEDESRQPWRETKHAE